MAAFKSEKLSDAFKSEQLVEAVESDNVLMARRLLEDGASANARKRITLKMRTRGPTKTGERIVKRGGLFSPDQREDVFETREQESSDSVEGESVLALAIIRGNAKMCALLLKHGADPNAEIEWRISAWDDGSGPMPLNTWNTARWRVRFVVPSALLLAIGNAGKAISWNGTLSDWTSFLVNRSEVCINPPGGHVQLLFPKTSEARMRHQHLTADHNVIQTLIRHGARVGKEEVDAAGRLPAVRIVVEQKQDLSFRDLIVNLGVTRLEQWKYYAAQRHVKQNKNDVDLDIGDEIHLDLRLNDERGAGLNVTKNQWGFFPIAYLSTTKLAAQPPGTQDLQAAPRIYYAIANSTARYASSGEIDLHVGDKLVISVAQIRNSTGSGYNVTTDQRGWFPMACVSDVPLSPSPPVSADSHAPAARQSSGPTDERQPDGSESWLIQAHRIVLRPREPFVGIGGFAQVRRGKLDGLTEVALKSLKRADAASKRATIREIANWDRLKQCPNILPLIGVYDDGNGLHMVSKLMTNGNIKEYIEANPEKSRLRMLEETAIGMAHLHEGGVIHGDLKPTNILVDADGHVAVADFGSSILEDSVSERGEQSGTRLYQSPERLRGGPPSKADDICAFGVTTYELFHPSRTTPHVFPEDGRSTLATYPDSREGYSDSFFRDLAEGKSRRLVEPSPQMPKELCDLIEQCWDPIPERRPHSFREVVHFIHSIAYHHPSMVLGVPTGA